MQKQLLLIIGFLLGIVSTGCSPRLVPLYYDYQAPDTTKVLPLVAQALRSTGWEVTLRDSLHLETSLRTLQHWGLYQVVVRLEAVPVEGHFVRLFIHPYRRYLTGHRSKIPYLPARLRATLLPQLHAALQEQGLKPAGTAFERDRIHLQW